MLDKFVNGVGIEAMSKPALEANQEHSQYLLGECRIRIATYKESVPLSTKRELRSPSRHWSGEALLPAGAYWKDVSQSATGDGHIMKSGRRSNMRSCYGNDASVG